MTFVPLSPWVSLKMEWKPLEEAGGDGPGVLERSQKVPQRTVSLTNVQKNLKTRNQSSDVRCLRLGAP